MMLSSTRIQTTANFVLLLRARLAGPQQTTALGRGTRGPHVDDRGVIGMTEEKRTARARGTQGAGDEGVDFPKHETRFRETPPEVNNLARRVIDAAVEVHRHPGPGYSESVYENALVLVLGLRGISFQRQAGFSVDYKGHEVGEGRMDLLIERLLIVELKAVDRFTDVNVSQALSYLKATGCRSRCSSTSTSRC